MPGRFVRGTEVRIREMGERKGAMGRRGRTSERERRGGGVREDDGGWKDVKKRGDRGTRGRDHSWKLPAVF